MSINKKWIKIIIYRYDTELFKNYIREFLQIKVQADGWPAQCRTSEFPDQLPDVDDLALTDEQRETVTRLIANRLRYVQLYKEIYDIQLDKADAFAFRNDPIIQWVGLIE